MLIYSKALFSLHSIYLCLAVEKFDLKFDLYKIGLKKIMDEEVA